MTLSIGLGTALSALSTSADQTALVSRNVARVGDTHATRKIANLASLGGGGVYIASISRVTSEALFEKMLGATSDLGAQKAIADALDQLDRTVNDPELDASPAALVAKLADSLQRFAAAPQDPILARSAIAAATDLAQGLNSATQTVQQVRSRADADMVDAVGQLNSLLAQFEAVNKEIVKGTKAGADVTDYLDQRDEILRGMSSEIGIRTIARADNDMAIFTDGGVTLFDVRARSVSLQGTLAFGPGTAGNAVYVDGVPITGGSGTMLTRSGRLNGLASVRDNVAVVYQNQLDEIARGLVEVFAESDQSAVPALPDAPGLFTYPGAPAMPAGGTLLAGLAGTISVNANADPDRGGDATRLRDGGISNPGNPAYIYNSSGGASYTDRLEQLLDGLNAQRAFDPVSQGASSATVAGFASSSVAWLQEGRKSAGADADYKNALLERSADALSNATGVSLDQEMALLLELERSYQASTKLISTIDNMLKTLLGVTP